MRLVHQGKGLGGKYIEGRGDKLHGEVSTQEGMGDYIERDQAVSK